MKLTELTITALTGKRVWKREIADALGVEYTTINKYLRQNRPNNLLTTVTVVRLIEKMTGLTEDQIVDHEKQAA